MDTTTKTTSGKLLARPTLEQLATARVPLTVLGFCPLLARSWHALSDRDELGERDRVEMQLTEALLDAGETWDEVAAATNRGSGQNAQRRYHRLGGTRNCPTPGVGRRSGRPLMPG